MNTKLQDYKRIKRDKILSSPLITPANAKDDKQNVSVVARKVIRKHRAVLVALRDR